MTRAEDAAKIHIDEVVAQAEKAKDHYDKLDVLAAAERVAAESEALNKRIASGLRRRLAEEMIALDLPVSPDGYTRFRSRSGTLITLEQPRFVAKMRPGTEKEQVTFMRRLGIPVKPPARSLAPLLADRLMEGKDLPSFVESYDHIQNTVRVTLNGRTNL